MDWKKLGKALLFPHIAILIILLPIAAVFLVYSMVFLGTESVIAILSYVLAAYTLTIWCFKIPYLIHFFKTFKEENKYARIWRDDTRLKVYVSLYGSLIYSITRKIFLGCTGGAISVFVVVMATYMIRQSSKKFKELK